MQPTLSARCFSAGLRRALGIQVLITPLPHKTLQACVWWHMESKGPRPWGKTG